jgi:hypothetical protein
VDDADRFACWPQAAPAAPGPLLFAPPRPDALTWATMLLIAHDSKKGA